MALAGGPLAGHDARVHPIMANLMRRPPNDARRWRSLELAGGIACASVLGAVLAVLPAGAADDPAPKPGQACESKARRQFDFWLGDWDVHDPSGKLVGRNRITRVHGGCALEEQWSGNGGVTGTSLNAYDPERDRWHQTWIDNTGGLLQLDGGWKDDRMVLVGQDAPSPGAPPTLQRISWQPLPDGRVRQLWEASKDAGRTWTTAFDGTYSRRPGTPIAGALP
jgi:hypothetical protein